MTNEDKSVLISGMMFNVVFFFSDDDERIYY